jgi:uncharacterized protein YbjT (DUF2867 family)
MSDKTFLVTGATSKQGGATARQLLKAGAKVRALTRKPDGKSAQALQAAGAEVVKGNLNDPASLDAAMKGIDGVFSPSPTSGNSVPGKKKWFRVKT